MYKPWNSAEQQEANSGIVLILPEQNNSVGVPESIALSFDTDDLNSCHEVEQ